jgi:hypothetical protein
MRSGILKKVVAKRAARRSTGISPCISKYHASRTTVPMSRLFTFTEGSQKVRVQCYLHTSDHAKQGWHAKAERTFEIGKAFQLG